MIPTDLNISPVLIAALGKPLAGRDTAMSFLVEELWENGYKNLIPIDTNKSIIEQVLNTARQNPYTKSTPKKNRPILMVNRLTYEEDYKLVAGYENTILIYVQRNPYKDGSHIHRELRDIESITPEWIIRAPAIPVRNDDGLRLLRCAMKDVFFNNILTHKTWRKLYEEQENQNTKSKTRPYPDTSYA